MAEQDSELQDVKLQFHYIKSNDYREVACHGVLGGVSPNGSIWFCMWNERGAIPRTVEFDVQATAEGRIQDFDEHTFKPAFVDSRPGIVRSVEVGAYLDVSAAERLHAWLGARIADAKSAAQDAKKPAR